MFILHKEIRWKEPAANAVEDDVDSFAVRPLLDRLLELLLPVVHLDQVKMWSSGDVDLDKDDDGEGQRQRYAARRKCQFE